MASKEQFAKCHPDRPKFCRGMCRSCYEKNLRQTNPEYANRQRENQRKWAESNPERIKEYIKRRTNNPEHRERDKQKHKQNYLSRKFGLSIECIEELKRIQGNACAICGRILDTVKAVHIDHNHNTGQYRGILCSKCNNGLGFFNDDIQLFTKAITYLQTSTGIKM